MIRKGSQINYRNNVRVYSSKKILYALLRKIFETFEFIIIFCKGFPVFWFRFLRPMNSLEKFGTKTIERNFQDGSLESQRVIVILERKIII